MPSVEQLPRGAGSRDFRMPSLGADMEFGTLVKWHTAPGVRVARGEVIAEVETEKGVFSVESPADGTIAALVVAEGTKVPVGTVLATFGAGAEEAQREPAPAAPAAPALTPRLRASPAARRRAAELGVDLAAVRRDGGEHAVTLAELERFAAQSTRMEAPAAAPAAPAPGPPSSAAAPGAPASVAEARMPAAAEQTRAAMRRAVAAAVTRANREIPHYYLNTTISLRRALAWLQDRNTGRPVEQRLLPAALLLRATAAALRRHPALNGFWTDGAFHGSQGVHLGVVIALRTGGIVAPAIHDADAMTVDALMDALRDLVRRAREGGLRGSEMTDATATVTNLGDDGAESVLGVIYPPQVALVGFGRIAERPWAEGGMLGVHPLVTATLAADHRATDGHDGSRFLATLDRLLQSPEER